MQGIAKQLKKTVKPARKSPLWAGPCGEGPQGGITFSLLSRFLVCRERFRLMVVEGLKPAPRFEPKMDFGTMWHAAEESLASERRHFGEVVGTTLWEDNLLACAKKMCAQYPLQQADVRHWHGVARMQFPLYVKHWAEHPDVTARTPLLQEMPFDVPCPLPSGRRVRLRGKFDSVDLIGKGKGAGIYLQENKTKQRIDEGQIKRQLTFDLQTMLYLIALKELRENNPSTTTEHFQGAPILGVRYNVVKRAEHRVGKKETEADFLARLQGIIEENPGEWFMRWKVEVGADDVARFKRECLDPVLEQLCDWWDWVKGNPDPWDYMNDPSSPPVRGIHFRMPYGVYNPLLEGNASDVDNYLATGSEAGLTRADNLFPELQEV